MKEPRGHISLERAEVYEAVYVNDIRSIIQLMEKFGFVEGAYPKHCLTEGMYELAFTVLAVMADADNNGALVQDFVFSVIDYLAGMIDSARLLAYFRPSKKDQDATPTPVRLSAIIKNIYRDNLASPGLVFTVMLFALKRGISESDKSLQTS